MITLFYYLLAGFVLSRIGKIWLFLKHLREFVYWKYVDFGRKRQLRKAGIIEFEPYGLTMYTGRQGAGKTTSLVHTLNMYHLQYPNALIYTNFKYKYATGQLTSLRQLETIRNGDDGVIFAITEIQNEFSSNNSKEFPVRMLSTITMQRKQHVKILADSQVFTRVGKPLREQCHEVVECRTFLGRWTRMRCYDALDYNDMLDATDMRKRAKIKKKWKKSFIQDDDLRNCFDTYEVIGRLSRDGFDNNYNYNDVYSS